MAISEYEKERIIAMYEISDKNARNAARLLVEEGISIVSQTITKYWKKEGLEMRKKGGNNGGHGRRLSDREKEIIMKAYPRYESPTLAARSLPYSARTIRYIWNEGIASGRIRVVSELERIVE